MYDFLWKVIISKTVTIASSSIDKPISLFPSNDYVIK